MFFEKLNLSNFDSNTIPQSNVNKSHSALACQITIILFRIAKILRVRWLFPSRKKYERMMSKLIRDRTFKLNPNSSHIEINEDLLEWSVVKQKYIGWKKVIIFLKKNNKKDSCF